MAGSDFKFYNVNHKYNDYIFNDSKYKVQYQHKLNLADEEKLASSAYSIANLNYKESIFINEISFNDTLKNLYNGPLSDQLLIETRENNLSTPYNTTVRLYYRIDNSMILVDSKSTSNGDVVFNGVNPGIEYCVIAEDDSGTYQSKSDSIVIEHDPDKDAKIEIITNALYDGYKHEFYFKVHSLVNVPIIYVSSEVGVPTVENIIPKNGENTYKVTLLSASRFYNLTITVEEARTSGNKITTKELKNISGANNSSSIITAEYFGSDVLFNISVANVIPDQINYYYSTSSMNPASMPPATSTIYSSKHRVNYGYNSIDHYIRFGVVKNGVETLSNEFVINKDPLSANVVYYAPFEQDFSDKSVNNITATSVGSTSIITGGGATGTGCLRTTGSGYLKLPININVGSGNFTIEMYYRYLNTDHFTNNGLFAFETNDGETYALIAATTSNTTGTATFYGSVTGTGWNMSGSGIICDNKWHHVEISRSGSWLYCYIDGIQIISSNNFSGSAVQKGINTFLGKISNNLTATTSHEFQHLRVTKGAARHNGSAFTPPRRFI